jgi:cardiolipin synthase
MGYCLYSEHYLIGVILFTFGGATDILDGFIARRYNMVTKWGKVFDPLADKLMQITALIFLTLHQYIPIIVLLIVIAKESLMLLGGILLYRKGKTVMGANWYGKLATVIFYFAIVTTIILKMDKFINAYTDTAVNLFIALAVCCTLFALIMYVIIYFRISRNYNKTGSKNSVNS